MKAIKGQKATIVTEDAIMSDSMKNIQMRKIFIFILFAIVGTAAILYLFGNSIMIAVIVLIIYYIALYLLMVVKQNNNDY